MYIHKRPAWRSLTVLGLLGGIGLLLEALLPGTERFHTLLLLFWVVSFHTGLFIWIRRNGEALEAEPPALDAAGRPIVDNGAPMFRVEAGQGESQNTPQSLAQSEAY